MVPKDHAVEDGYVENEQENDGDGVENGAAAQQVIEDIVGGSVALHEEHVVGSQGDVSDVGGDAEAAQDGIGDPGVLLLQATHARKSDVQGSESRDAVRHARGHVVQGQDGVGVVVLTGTYGAQDTAQQAEDQHEVQGGLSQLALGKGGQGDGDELDAAQEQGQVVLPGGGIAASVEHDNDLKDLHDVYEDGRDDEGAVLFLVALASVAEAEKDGQGQHGEDQAGGEDEMLRGEVSFGLAGVAADAEKFFHGDSFLWLRWTFWGGGDLPSFDKPIIAQKSIMRS